jgi:drug/metabolite transporter (DMT)-like permease
MGWIFLGEKITMRVAIGAVCIVAGIALATLRTRLGAITTRLGHDART